MKKNYFNVTKLFKIVVLLLVSSNAMAQSTWFVNDNSTTGDIYCTAVGASGNNGTSPTTPKATLSEVLALPALANGDIIYVDAGNYSDHTLSFNKGLTVLGAGIDKTIFQRASGTRRLGTITVSNVKIKNLKILNYNQTSDGISLNISASSGDLTGILLEALWIDKSQASGGDGAINIFSSSTQKITVDFKNSIITCSTNGNYGSAIYIEGNGHTINIDKCHIESNAKATAGGALSVLGTDSTDANKTLVTINKTTFKSNSGNSGVSGGAIYVNGAQLNISESCFNGNTTTGFGTAIAGGRRSKIYVTKCNFENNSGGTAQIYTSYQLNAPTTSAGNTILEVKESKFDESAGTPKAIFYRGGASGDYCLVENSTFTGTSNFQLESYSGTYPFTIRKSGNPTKTGTFTVDNTDTPDVFVSPICGGSISGNCAGGFTISCALDIFPPVINATNQTLPTNPTCTFTVPTFTATDNCDATPTVTSVPAAGSSLAINTTTDVTITATDNSGNTSVVVVRITTPTACTPGCSIKTWTTGAWSPAGEPTTSDEVVINDDFNTNTLNKDINCCKLTVNAGKTLTITSDRYALVVNEVINNGNFTIENNGSLVQEDNTKTNTGNIIYKRLAKAKNSDYVYWSSPVASYVLSGHVATGPKYIWNTIVSNANSTQGAWGAAPATLGLAQGVIIRGNANFSDVSTTINNFENIFTGVPNNGTITKTIYRGNLQNNNTLNGVVRTPIDDNHNLIGNPYPSAISAKDFLTLNSAHLTGALQIWTHGTLVGNNGQSFYGNFSNSYSASDYAPYNLTGNLAAPGVDYYIGAGQGFFVAMIDGATASNVNITFNNTLRNKTYGNSSTSGTPNFYRYSTESQNQNQAHKFWLDLVAENGTSSRTLVAYTEGATNQKDNLHDATTKPQGSLLLYSKLGEDRLNIQGKALPFVVEDQVPMGYFAPAAGNYNLALAFVEGEFNNGQSIYVKDNLLNTYHNLSQNPYLFNSNAGENQDRFVIVYQTNLNNYNFNNTDISIYINDLISIKSKENIVSIEIFDVLGKLIRKYENLSTTSFQDDFNVSNGVYIVKLKTDKNNSISKKVLK